MYAVGRFLSQSCRKVHTWSYEGPCETLRQKIFELRLKKKMNKPKGINVTVPGSTEFLDTITMPMVIMCVAVAYFSKLLVVIDDSKSQERIERKIKNAPPGQGTVRMLDREEWDYIRDLPPRTPFESKLVRKSAPIRNNDSLSIEDVKYWSVDVLTDALTRAEDTVRRGSNFQEI